MGMAGLNITKIAKEKEKKTEKKKSDLCICILNMNSLCSNQDQKH